jgi:hypothetical protein
MFVVEKSIADSSVGVSTRWRHLRLYASEDSGQLILTGNDRCAVKWLPMRSALLERGFLTAIFRDAPAR